MRRFVTRYGMRLGAARFVAGETLDQFLVAAERANLAGFAVAGGILGEDTRDEPAAVAATTSYCDLLARISDARLDANVALKATHLGLGLSSVLAMQNALSVATAAQRFGNFMRLDMEQSGLVDETLGIYRQLRTSGHDNVGFVLQSYLYRSLDDLTALLPLGTNVRIVKGAYLEPASVAYQHKTDVDTNYMRLVARSLAEGQYTAIATHDPALLLATIALVDQHRVPKDRFEFQMLYGVTARSATQLRERGYRVRLAIPFGSYWFPYLMRRLAERPANLGFFLRNLIARS